MKALVIDDSRTMRRVIGSTIEVLGYETLEAMDGQEALAVLAEHPAQSFSSVDLYRRFLAEQSAVSLRTIARALECLGSLGAIQRDEAAPGGSHAWRWHARRGHGGD